MVKKSVGEKGFIVNDYRQTTLRVNYYPKKEKGYPNYSCDGNNFFPSKSDIDSLPIHVLIIIHHQAITAATIRANIRASLVPFVKVFHLFFSSLLIWHS
jgi:hypothetical protein